MTRRRFKDYRDYLKERGVPFGKPWVVRVEPAPDPQPAENVVPIIKGKAKRCG